MIYTLYNILFYRRKTLYCLIACWYNYTPFNAHLRYKISKISYTLYTDFLFLSNVRCWILGVKEFYFYTVQLQFQKVL